MSGERKRSREEDDLELDYETLFNIVNDSPQPKPLSKKLKYASKEDSHVAIPESEKLQTRLAPVVIERNRKPLPTRLENGKLFFPDFPEFQPNLTPKEILGAGSFGGCYFQNMTSRITGKTYSDAWTEFPSDWFEGLDISTQVASPTYNKEINAYKVPCGSSVQQWEEAGWVTSADPYGWFQWYCRFFLGRRCTDDYRQINRALGVMGPTGRWRKNLINKCLNSGKTPEESVRDYSISPKIRQLLQQWGYRLTVDDLISSPRKMRTQKDDKS